MKNRLYAVIEESTTRHLFGLIKVEHKCMLGLFEDREFATRFKKDKIADNRGLISIATGGEIQTYNIETIETDF